MGQRQEKDIVDDVSKNNLACDKLAAPKTDAAMWTVGKKIVMM